MKKTRLAAVALVAALAPTGAAVAGTATTPAQYRQQATAVCKRTSAKLKTVKDPTSAKDAIRYLKQALPIFRAQYTALGKLTVPRALGLLHRKALVAEKGQIIGIQGLIAALERGGNLKATYAAFEKRLTPLSNAEDAAWKKLRVPACASL
jgi:hypothetical protein